MKKLLPILFISLAALWSCEEDNIPVNDEIRSFIEQRYEGAKILYAEKEFNGEVDVEIIHDNIKKEVKFNRKNHKLGRCHTPVARYCAGESTEQLPTIHH